ncbi:MFS transporter [Cellulomonas marina]|uniref:MFS transporter, NNP family, nitrate/nitrite transporter n=1 Tax=Cellulomonas marina TaxID=988821 RepID=A0A1I0ZQU6_9CELL|nr:nitrate/nitrite transporter [Cellulomonas marina]GIG28845.1 MFS transporter [Cellulomonas marina]SFB27732.1 MFS transporter, NNP family, nitrate/nitrite transporter [Cellulomonas marina]
MAVPTLEATPAPPSPSGRRRGRWIDHWDPEDQGFWERTGRSVARRNLVWSVLAEHIGFSVWLLWSIVVVQMTADATTGLSAAPGWNLTTSQALWLVAVPSGVGALLRIPYTFAVPVFGGRNWTVVSALLLVIPCLGLAWAVSNPGIPFGLLLAVAATAGLGGGNFASSMANISFFYPEREKGFALGLNAAGGNIGVAVVQKVVPLVVVAGGGLVLARAGLMYVPLAVAAAVLAFLFMDNLTEAKADWRPVVDSTRRLHTWVLSFLYIGTFGSFIGYSSAFPSLLKSAFDRADIALAWGFLGAGIGSVARPIGGKLSDRYGGALITALSFGLMTVGGVLAIVGVQTARLPVFFAAFMLLFVATGIGNGSTYRMIPAIFRSQALARGAGPDELVATKREAAGALGIISSVGAFGGFLVPICYAWAKASTGSIMPALQLYVGVFVVMLVVTWAFYLRRGAAARAIGA